MHIRRHLRASGRVPTHGRLRRSASVQRGLPLVLRSRQRGVERLDLGALRCRKALRLFEGLRPDMRSGLRLDVRSGMCLGMRLDVFLDVFLDAFLDVFLDVFLEATKVSSDRERVLRHAFRHVCTCGTKMYVGVVCSSVSLYDAYADK